MIQFHFFYQYYISFNFTSKAIVRVISDVCNVQGNCMYIHILETFPIHLPVKKQSFGWLRLQPLFPESLSRYLLPVQEVEQQGQSQPGRAVRHTWMVAPVVTD